MVTQMLHQCGFYLGSDEDMMPPQAHDNPLGYWENLVFTHLNDDILEVLGGSWNHPPEIQPEWWKQPAFDAFRARARALITDFEQHALWGWKDPRNCLTLPFWLELIPDLKVVFCLRNPLEIVWSLSRGGETRSFLTGNTLKVWLTYHERLLSAMSPEAFITTHYLSYFYDGQAELRRVLDALGMEVDEEALEQATTTIKPELRHAIYEGRRFPQDGVPVPVAQLYHRLCEQAGPIYQQMLDDEAYQAEQIENTIHKQYVMLAAESDRKVEALTELEVLKETNEGLNESVRHLEGEKETLEAERGTLAESVSRLEEEKATAIAERVALAESVGRLEGEKAALETERGVLAESLGRLEGEKAALETEHAALKTERASLETERVALAESVGRLKGEKAALETERGALAESLGRLEGEKSALEAERVMLAESVGRLEGEKAALAESVGRLEGQRADLETQKTHLVEAVGRLKGEKAAHEAEWAALRTERAVLETERIALEVERAALDADRTALDASIHQFKQRRVALENEHAALAQRTERLAAEQVRLHDALRKREQDYMVEQAQRAYLQQERDRMYRSRLLRGLIKMRAARRLGIGRTLKKLGAGMRSASPVRLAVDFPPSNSAVVASKPLFVAGWTFSRAAPVGRIDVFIGETLLAAVDHGVDRPDVASAFPGEHPAAQSGFSAFVAMDKVAPGKHDLVIRVTDQAGNSLSMRRPIVITAGGTAAGRRTRWLSWHKHHITLEPVADEQQDGAGDAFWYRLRSSRDALPSGRTLVSFQVAQADVPLLPELYVKDHPAAEPTLAHQLPTIPAEHQVQRLVFLPPSVATLLFRPHYKNVRFEIDDFRVYELGGGALFIVVAVLWLKRQARHPGRLLGKAWRGMKLLFSQGPRAFWLRLVQAQIDHQNAVTYPLERAALPGTPAGDAAFGKYAKEAFTASATAKLDRFLESGKILTLAAPESPRVSIVIILYNRAELTLACLQSLADHAGDAYEVILIDNASADRTGALLQQVEGVTVIENEENKGFVTACNQGAAVARGAYILLLNNDAVLRPGALDAAVRTLESADDIGVVGARIILLDGALQEAGCIVWNDGSCEGYGRGDDPTQPMYMYQRDVDFCSGAFLLTRKTLWDSLDGFDEVFAPAYYEEVDYCLRARQAGWRTVYDPNSVIHHYEFGSSSNAEKAIELQVRNRSTFVAKHAETLRSHYGPSPKHLLLARSADRKPRVLVIDDKVPHTYLGSGFPRANFMLHTLVELGYAVTFYPKQFPEEEWHVVYTDLPAGVEVMTGYGNKHLKAFLEARRGFYDAVAVSRPHNMADVAYILRARPELMDGVRLIYDAEAIFALREIEEQRLRGNAMKESAVKALIEKELRPAQIADQVTVVSPQERAIFLDNGVTSVHVLAHAVEPAPTPNAFAGRAHFLFVGSLAAEPSPNVDSVLWFLDHVFPTIYQTLTARGESVEFLVVGKNTCASLATRRDPGVRFLGVVDDLTPLYNQARVFVAPTRFAAGIPHKIHEAAGHGLPVVATQLLADQLRWTDGEDLLSSDASDPNAFIRHCIDLYTDEGLWTKLRENALARIEEECSPERFAQVLKEVLS